VELKAILDTNILIDYLSGRKEAEKEISLYSEPAISIITWMEVLVGAEEEELPSIKNFLSSFQIINLTKDVAEESIHLRKKFRIKLPDSIIWASATHQGWTLVTRNTKDFQKSFPNIRIPYKIPS
jgi:predicted nucleic acid-binding protein